MSDFERLRELRALRRAVEPQTDLWPTIAARIGAAAPPRRRRAWPEALAAVLVVGLAGFFGLDSERGVSSSGRQVTPVAEQPWSVREAQALDAIYAGALREAWRSAPVASAALEHAGRDLDLAQRDLERALVQQPDAVHLLELLRRTHEIRLRLAQRQPTLS